MLHKRMDELNKGKGFDEVGLEPPCAPCTHVCCTEGLCAVTTHCSDRQTACAAIYPTGVLLDRALLACDLCNFCNHSSKIPVYASNVKGCVTLATVATECYHECDGEIDKNCQFTKIPKEFMDEEKDYYTAKEAQEKLGLSKAMFHRRANEGLIRRKTVVGHKQAIYSKADIDALATSINWVFEYQERFEFSRSTPGEQVEEMDIGIRCFGAEYITPLPERIAFQRKNSATFWSLKVSGHGVVSYISMFHFPPDFLEDILTGRRIEREITLKEVLPFPRSTPFDVYIDVLATDPALPVDRRHYYAGVLVSRFIDQVLNLIGTGFLIRNFYTVTATEEGDHLVRDKVGFQLLEGKSLVPGRTAYVYPISKESLERLAKRFSRRGVYRDIRSRTEDKSETD